MNREFKALFESDMIRYQSKDRYSKKFSYYFRKCQTTSNRLLKLYYRICFKRIKEKRGIEISHMTKIGKGFYLGHPYNITINAGATIGENCNIHKGVTIGQENRGMRRGVPTIGNCVWIGVNSTIVGKINVGDDVLIAPNTYINCDIPDHSVVFGNPCVIKYREKATENYINRMA